MHTFLEGVGAGEDRRGMERVAISDDEEGSEYEFGISWSGGRAHRNEDEDACFYVLVDVVLFVQKVRVQHSTRPRSLPMLSWLRSFRHPVTALKNSTRLTWRDTALISNRDEIADQSVVPRCIIMLAIESASALHLSLRQSSRKLAVYEPFYPLSMLLQTSTQLNVCHPS